MARYLRTRQNVVIGNCTNLSLYSRTNFLASPTPVEGDECYKKIGEWKAVKGETREIPFAVGQRVKTRDGRDARIICADRADYNGFSVIALIEDHGIECVVVNKASGRYSDGAESNRDLIPLKEKTPDTIQLVMDEE